MHSTLKFLQQVEGKKECDRFSSASFSGNDDAISPGVFELVSTHFQ
jgi:hypothetical protein